MARARNIKPSFFTNEDLIELDFGTRLLFIGLWTLCDREGRLEDRPKKIKMELFPADNIDVNEALAGLESFGFISRYVADGKRVIQVLKFSEHQSPHGKEQDSELPDATGTYTKHVRSPNGHVTGKTEDLSINKTVDSVKENSKPDTSPRQAQGKPTLNPESPFLNPESPFLNPESREEREEIAVLTESENPILQAHREKLKIQTEKPEALPTTNRPEPKQATVSMEVRGLVAELHRDTQSRIAGYNPKATRYQDETSIAELLANGATVAHVKTVWGFATTDKWWAGRIASPKDLVANWVKLSQDHLAKLPKPETTSNGWQTRSSPASATKNGKPIREAEGWTAQEGEGWYTPWGTKEGWHDGKMFENDCEMMGVGV